jgi:hypothetical protein
MHAHRISRAVSMRSAVFPAGSEMVAFPLLIAARKAADAVSAAQRG